MSGALDTLIQGLDQTLTRGLDSARDGLARASSGVQQRMQATTAHGDRTGATRASYTAFVVGRGDTGADAMDAALAAVEEDNPGHSASAPVTIDADLGVIITSGTDYQEQLETQASGAKAVLGPTLTAEADGLTAAAAAGSRAALGG